MHGVSALAHPGARTLVLPGPSPRGKGLPEAPIRSVQVDDLDTLRGLAPLLAEAARGDGVRVEMRMDLTMPVQPRPVAEPASPVGLLEPDDDLLRDVARAARVVVLVGAGVVDRNAVGGLRVLAAAGRLGVLNTWCAKGVFHWQSRHHWATVGLQERDFELGGIPGADLVLAVGVDEREAPTHLWSGGRSVRSVAPEMLSPLAERWPATATAFPDLPPLRQRLAAVTQAGWTSTATPLAPSLVTRHYAQALGQDGLVAADSGTAGFWVARTLATTRLRSALVPAAPVRGWAASCAFVARRANPLRRVLAVADGPLDGETDAVLVEANRRDASFGSRALGGRGAAGVGRYAPGAAGGVGGTGGRHGDAGDGCWAAGRNG